MKNLKLQQLRSLLVAFGFIWMALWALFGSLIGFKIQEELIAGQSVWLDSTQRELFRSAHAHMNTFSLLAIVTGLCLPIVARQLSQKLLVALCLSLTGSIFLFGAGMMLEAFSPSQKGQFSSSTLVTAFGGSVLIITLLFFGVSAFMNSRGSRGTGPK